MSHKTGAVEVRALGNSRRSYRLTGSDAITYEEIRITKDQHGRLESIKSPLSRYFSPPWLKIIGKIMAPKHVLSLKVDLDVIEVEFDPVIGDSMNGYYDSHIRSLMGDKPDDLPVLPGITPSRYDPYPGYIQIRTSSGQMWTREPAYVGHEA